jgi:hypothetical protein
MTLNIKRSKPLRTPNTTWANSCIKDFTADLGGGEVV